MKKFLGFLVSLVGIVLLGAILYRLGPFSAAGVSALVAAAVVALVWGAMNTIVPEGSPRRLLGWVFGIGVAYVGLVALYAIFLAPHFPHTEVAAKNALKAADINIAAQENVPAARSHDALMGQSQLLGRKTGELHEQKLQKIQQLLGSDPSVEEIAKAIEATEEVANQAALMRDKLDRLEAKIASGTEPKPSQPRSLPKGLALAGVALIGLAVGAGFVPRTQIPGRKIAAGLGALLLVVAIIIAFVPMDSLAGSIRIGEVTLPGGIPPPVDGKIVLNSGESRTISITPGVSSPWVYAVTQTLEEPILLDGEPPFTVLEFSRKGESWTYTGVPLEHTWHKFPKVGGGYYSTLRITAPMPTTVTVTVGDVAAKATASEPRDPFAPLAEPACSPRSIEEMLRESGVSDAPASFTMKLEPGDCAVYTFPQGKLYTAWAPQGSVEAGKDLASLRPLGGKESAIGVVDSLTVRAKSAGTVRFDTEP